MNKIYLYFFLKSLSELEELANQQNRQLRRLERLVNKSNELCDDLKLSELTIQNLKIQESGANKFEDVFKKQETLFKKIESLTEKVRQTYEEMGLNSPTTDLQKLNIKSADNETKKNREPFKVDLALFERVKRATSKLLTGRNIEDLVIYADPSTIPQELLNFVDVLSQNAKIFIKFYIHSSVFNQLSYQLENRLLNIGDLFEGLRLGINENRVDYDLGFTFIWRKSNAYLNFSNKIVY